MRAWFLSLFRFREVSLPNEMKALWGTEQTARIVYATAAESMPTREEAQERLAAAEIMAEIQWREQEREKERAASPKVRTLHVRRVK